MSAETMMLQLITIPNRQLSNRVCGSKWAICSFESGDLMNEVRNPNNNDLDWTELLRSSRLATASKYTLVFRSIVAIGWLAITVFVIASICHFGFENLGLLTVVLSLVVLASAICLPISIAYWAVIVLTIGIAILQVQIDLKDAEQVAFGHAFISILIVFESHLHAKLIGSRWVRLLVLASIFRMKSSIFCLRRLISIVLLVT